MWMRAQRGRENIMSFAIANHSSEPERIPVSTTSRTRSQTRLSRSLGIALIPKAARYLEKRPYGPGQHGRTKRKSDSDYAVRLREKQRLRAQYGIREKQLVIAFNKARRQDGLTGEN